MRFSKEAAKARLAVVDVAERVGGVHFGGIFSCVDFLSVFYGFQRKKLEAAGRALHDYYFGQDFNISHPLIFSKGHCYLAQLVCLDSVFEMDHYASLYLSDGTQFFGHPKRDAFNLHFPVSAGSLGQGAVFANGKALAAKLNCTDVTMWVLLGDGEFNEGAVTEALLFAVQHCLSIVFVLDNNGQQSLQFTAEILSNRDIQRRVEGLGMTFFDIEGHNHDALWDLIVDIDNGLAQFPIFVNMRTVKGFGVSFMEKDFKWHSRRLKGDELTLARDELLVSLATDN